MERRTDAFTACHPAVNLLFFLGAIVCCALVLHPVYLAVCLFSAVACWVSLRGRKAWKSIGTLLLLGTFVAAINPLFNLNGTRVLFSVGSRPYTLEALLLGAALGAMVCAMLLWFLCWNAVMTEDKLTALLGRVIPSLSMVFIMVLRMIPAYRRKAQDISSARQCVGLSGTSRREILQSGMTTLSALSGWALESSVVTADSMRARGYGQAKRTNFRLYRMSGRDCIFLIVLGVLLCAMIASIALGWTAITFTPVFHSTSVLGLRILGPCVYLLFFLFPTLINLQEALLWHFLRLKI